MVISKRPTFEEYEESVKNYIKELQMMDQEEAKKISIETLIRTEVLDENGQTKEQIVTGDFFGWQVEDYERASGGMVSLGAFLFGKKSGE